MVHKKIKLLIVDDEKDICEFEKSYLKRRNFDVSTAQTGTKALTLARRAKPDIALIDIHMAKGISGIEILKKLLKTHPKCKCIMATWDRERAQQAKKIGAVDILIKPAKIKDLEKTVNRVAKKLNKK